MLNQIVRAVSDAIPDFNRHLLFEYRQKKIEEMAGYLDTYFSNVPLFKGELGYLGFHVMDPEERMEYMLSKLAAESGAIQIRKTTMRLIRYDFQYENMVHSLYVEFPYVDNGAVHVDGTANYPLFIEVEKVIHHSRDKIILRATGAPIYFLRKVRHTARSVGGKVYDDFVLTTKLHWGATSAAAKKRVERTPILLYHLCVFGLNKTLKKYGFSEEEVKFATEPSKEAGVLSFKLKKDAYLLVVESSMSGRMKSRAILAILHIIATHPRFGSLDDLFEPNNVYYKVTLGSYIDIQNNQIELCAQANSHLKSLQTMLDPAAKTALRSVNLDCEDIFDLLYHAFHKLDEWMIHNPTNLYSKQIASLDHILSVYIRWLMKSQYKALHSRSGVSEASIKRFVRSVPFRTMKGTGHVFRPTTDIYNSCMLLTIGAKRIRSVIPIDRMGKPGAKPPSPPLNTISMDPSEFLVESVLAIPSSSPIVSGSINPFLEIDEDGNIIRPALADEIANVYD